MEQITDYNFLLFIKDTYPISFIGIVLSAFGYTMGAIGYRHHIKSLDKVIIETLQKILERLH